MIQNCAQILLDDSFKQFLLYIKKTVVKRSHKLKNVFPKPSLPNNHKKKTLLPLPRIRLFVWDSQSKIFLIPKNTTCLIYRKRMVVELCENLLLFWMQFSSELSDYPD